VTGIGRLPFRHPHAAVQCVAQTCPLVPCWPELPRRSPEARSVEQTFSAFADLVRPRRTGSGYEVVPGRLAALLERLEQAPARLEPARSAGFFAFEQAMAAGLFARAVALNGQLIGPLTLAWQFAVHTELIRAVSLLGYTLQGIGAGTASQALGADAEEHGDDAAFMRTHGLRFCEDEPPDAPLQEP